MWIFISFILHPPDFTEMSNFSQAPFAAPKHLIELKSSTHFGSCSLYWDNFGKYGFIRWSLSSIYVTLCSEFPEYIETCQCWGGRKFYEKAIVFPNWLHPSAARIKLLTHTPWLLACTRSPKRPVGEEQGLFLSHHLTHHGQTTPVLNYF